jgi:hypothetical protein
LFDDRSARGAALAKTLTDDAVIEYPTDRAGLLLAVDGGSFGTECVDDVSTLKKQTLSLERIYPTADPITVFVEYGAVSETRLVMLEMRGDRISRIRNFTGLCAGNRGMQGIAPTLHAENAR